MATLNIKSFPDKLYRRLQKRARDQHRSVRQEVTNILSPVLEESEPLSLLDLKGLGKEQWKGIEAARHVEEERKSWD